MLEFWNNLQIPSLSEAWRGFPPVQRAMSLFALGLIFGYFFFKDYGTGGKRFLLYGSIAVFLLGYAVVTADFF